MFLFTKKGKKVVKWVWGVLATLVMVSMVLTYSGITMLARTQTTPAQDIPPDVLAQLEAQKNASTSPELRALLDKVNASGTVQLGTGTVQRTGENVPVPPTTPTTPPPPVPQLDFSL
ncbi:MAG: hypothetical protein KBD24_03915 [Candidatus Pacebacteria bacterium]|nr:hypothetical protein [Candidatus Paceibacterota bacterium]